MLSINKGTIESHTWVPKLSYEHHSIAKLFTHLVSFQVLGFYQHTIHTWVPKLSYKHHSKAFYPFGQLLETRVLLAYHPHMGTKAIIQTSQQSFLPIWLAFRYQGSISIPSEFSLFLGHHPLLPPILPKKTFKSSFWKGSMRSIIQVHLYLHTFQKVKGLCQVLTVILYNQSKQQPN